MTLCSSRRNPYPPQGRSKEIPRGRGGVLKAKIIKATYQAKLEFSRGGEGGAKQKNLQQEKYGYFLELHIFRFCKGPHPMQFSGGP